MQVLVGVLTAAVILLVAATTMLAFSVRRLVNLAPMPAHPVPGRQQAAPVPVEHEPEPGYLLNGVDLVGAPLSVSVSSERPILLAFLTAGCSTCARFWELFANAEAIPRETSLVVIAHSGDLDDPEQLHSLASNHYPVLRSSDYWDDFDVPVGPYFVIIEPSSDQVIDEGRAIEATELDQLLKRAGVR